MQKRKIPMCFKGFSFFMILVFCSLSHNKYDVAHAWTVAVPTLRNNYYHSSSIRRTSLPPPPPSSSLLKDNHVATTPNSIPRQTSSYLSLQQSISNNDDDARSQFGTKEYWDDLYAGRGEFPADEYSWYFGWGEYQTFVKEFVPNKDSKILLPGIGNDPILLDLLQNGYQELTATDYSDHAIERQEDLISYSAEDSSLVELRCMDARQMDEGWTERFDAVLEKGALDAIYLSGDGNLELAVQELERCVKPGGVIVSVSGVVPEELRREVFKNWEWIRDGSDDLKAGCFVLVKSK